MNTDAMGYVSQIQSFSVNDGNGIRTTIFLSGCPLRCKWCANPETWIMGKRMSVGEILKQVKRDMIFFRESGGGVTFSGGEPTFQQDFLRTLVNAHMDMGIDMAIETSGFFVWEEVKGILEKLDQIFVDIKHMDTKKHKSLTGVDNELILENIKKMGSLNQDVVVRIPLIKGINDDRENIADTAAFVMQYVPEGKIEVLPYHDLGVHKYDALGLNRYKNRFDTPAKQEIDAVKQAIAGMGVAVTDYK